MKKAGVLLLLALFPLLIIPVSAIDYSPVTYTTSDVTVTFQITAPDYIASPFTVDVHANITVEPVRAEITQINVTEVTLMITKDNGGSVFVLLAADSITFPTGQVGSQSIGIIADFTLVGTGTGTRCFFALSVKGIVTDTTGNYSFRADSPQDLVGPFNVPPSLNSPITQIGIIVMVLSAICVAAGVYGVKKVKTPAPKKKRGLLDE